MLRKSQYAVLASAALISSSLIGGMSAGAAPVADPRSTTVDTAPADGTLMSYVVNLKPTKINHGQMKKAEKLISQSGGTVVQSWPQIGVIVAHSTKAAFVDKLPRSANSPIEAAGQTRTTEVAEGTPKGNPVLPPGQRPTAGAPDTYPAPSAPATFTPEPMEDQQPGNREVQADAAHQISQGSPGVLVGVLDTGVDGTHPDLAPNFRDDKSVSCQNAGVPERKNWEPTDSNHGTHVAGTIAAARNGKGIAGIAPKTSVASIRVASDQNLFYPEYVVCGIVWAADQGFDITNHSYFVDPWMFWCDDQANQAPGREAVRRALAYATDQGVSQVAAAGNSDIDLANKTTDDTSPNDSTPAARTLNPECRQIPAEMPGVVSVGATQTARDIWTKRFSSNYGADKITVVAPGSRILSTVPGGGYGSLSGTSMAAPHVAGVLALMKASHPDATPAELTSMLIRDATPVPCAGAPRCLGTPELNNFFGHGFVNALKAVSSEHHE
ncbi:S8 family peptidase [Demetria terragena]|uniref:S8 family peptidase n=1 Tax=Demetria terragena TaxID=63959 RepID=UPI00036E1695|nr:S8 family serine peptidase [Demetria terragena]